MPVVYAAVICVLFFVAIVAFPFFPEGSVKSFSYLVLGAGIPVCCYMVFFLADPKSGFLNYFWFFFEILLLGAGLLAFIPFYLLHHIRVYYLAGNSGQRRLLWVGALSPCLALLVYLFSFHQYLVVANQQALKAGNKAAFVTRLPTNYFTERMLGLHWKYHTCLNYIYDGWRPPLHDPFLVVALYVFGPEMLPAKNTMWPDCNEEGVRYYHHKFPEKAIKVWCPCSYSRDGLGYSPDSVWYGSADFVKRLIEEHKGH